jgi:pyruvate,water dikinase
MTAVGLVEASDPSQFGGKAVELGRARRNGLPVPDGVALSVELVDAVAAGHGVAIEAVHEVFARLGGEAVAARSSAVGEDGASASFAGQHTTKLNVVSADGLIAAVIEVRASGHTGSALAYRKRAGVAGAPRVAVVVQRLIHAELAGVLFTRCPVTGRDERIVEAARGLGEVVVAGLVNPERVRIDRAGRVIERALADQDLMIVAHAAGGTEEQPVADRRAALLTDHHVGALHELASRCEGVFGDGGHDVEWAFVKGSVFLLQRRPITR